MPGVTAPADFLSSAPALIALLTVLTVLLLTARIRAPWAPVYAVARGTLQLAVLAFVLTGAISSAGWVAAFLVLMFSVAWWTAFKRARALGRSTGTGRTAAVIGLGMFLGTGVTLVTIFGLRGLEFSPSYLLALGGIIIGNCMTLSTLTVRRLNELLHDRWPEVEGWLALGATPRQATSPLARSAVYSAIVPTTDTTRTTGLVTLPGAFVGALFGGSSPYEAGLFQVFVLVGILTAGAVVSITIAMTLAPGAKKPVVTDS
ncbi:hypothetical protein HMPREF3162_00560 [Brevibacterium sp. HMSC07C04]|nr:hypothetical protein HMPREF3162_00560 [Brevibacterium sp. HMSC07C04]